MADQNTDTQNQNTTDENKKPRMSAARHAACGVAKVALSVSIFVAFGAAYTYGYNKAVNGSD